MSLIFCYMKINAFVEYFEMGSFSFILLLFFFLGVIPEIAIVKTLVAVYLCYSNDFMKINI